MHTHTHTHTHTRTISHKHSRKQFKRFINIKTPHHTALLGTRHQSHDYNCHHYDTFQTVFKEADISHFSLWMQYSDKPLTWQKWWLRWCQRWAEDQWTRSEFQRGWPPLVKRTSATGVRRGHQTVQGCWAPLRSQHQQSALSSSLSSLQHNANCRSLFTGARSGFTSFL